MLRAPGRAGNVGGVRRVAAATGGADFSLSASSVTTAWTAVVVGELVPVNAPAGAFFMLVEAAGATGDDTGLAVVNG